MVILLIWLFWVCVSIVLTEGGRLERKHGGHGQGWGVQGNGRVKKFVRSLLQGLLSSRSLCRLALFTLQHVGISSIPTGRVGNMAIQAGISSTPGRKHDSGETLPFVLPMEDTLCLKHFSAFKKKGHGDQKYKSDSKDARHETDWCCSYKTISVCFVEYTLCFGEENSRAEIPLCHSNIQTEVFGFNFLSNLF